MVPDHLLTNPADANYVAGVIASWVARYLPAEQNHGDEDSAESRMWWSAKPGKESSRFRSRPGRTAFSPTSPQDVGGSPTPGRHPMTWSSAGLGACTAMTLRMYVRLKKIDLGLVTVAVSHHKVHAADCLECTDEERANGGKIDRFERVISIDGGTPEGLADKIAEIADKCPVHRTIEHGAKVVTTLR
jgi:uncharacterized OsmC-like protein